jgi:SAM-dependent methyltransferase
MVCNLCDTADVEPVRFKDRDGQPLRSVICRGCGLVWTDPRPSAAELRAFYAREYRLAYKGLHQPTPRHVYRAGKVALDRVGRLRPHLAPRSRLLDVGAGSGEVVYVLRAMGHDASGVEPNEGYAQYAVRTLGVPIAAGFYQDADVSASTLDAVTMFHTLEHLDDPLAVLRRAREWLVPGGVLLVEVPNVEAVCQQPHQQFHRGHLFHFNVATLEHLGRRAGLAVVQSAASADGGNIWTVFRRTADPPPVAGAIPGNYARVRAILKGHTALRHLLSRYPYVRPVAKLAARLDERWRTFGRSGAPEVLDALIRASPAPDGTPVGRKQPQRSAAGG